MSSLTTTWFSFATLQMVAESYLDDVWSVQSAERDNRLRLGNNSFAIFPNGDPNVFANLPGKTRMTDTQITYFNATFEIIDHLPNTASGFSATLRNERGQARYL